jgi:hypothetical protein
MRSHLALVLVIYPAILVILHALYIRAFSDKKAVSGQKDLLTVISVVFPLYLVGTILSDRGLSHDLSAMIYLFMVLAAVTYFYFHIFNMSETARRIKILSRIYKGEWKRENDLGGYREQTDPVEIRLKRLVMLKAVALGNDGRYVLKSRILLFAAGAVKAFRELLKIS